MGGRSKPPIGVQLYSVRADCAKDLPGTIAAVAEMGYEGVEFAGYYDHTARDLRKILDDNGLRCCGTHTAMDTLSDENLEATIEFNQILGNRFLIVPYLAADSRDAWLRYAERFNVLADKVKPHGMWVGYHSHAGDFNALDGQMPWDLLFGNTRSDVVMQIDTGNTMDGGGDPVAFLNRYPGRALTVHLKEHSATNKRAILGEGDVEWQEVFTLCETTGRTQWYIIEEEKDAYPPLKAVEMCLQNYRRLRA
ncbi:MAG: sugar phosphate isomerase/epimerase [Phycisphaerae bacterium]|nr:sugar phosphate isomerase/epimerase [Phycisphaerae bacterium]